MVHGEKYVGPHLRGIYFANKYSILIFIVSKSIVRIRNKEIYNWKSL